MATSPRQPWLHEYEIAVHGNITAVSDRAGRIGAPGTGVVVDDRRVLSRLAIELGGEAPVPIAAVSLGETTEIWASARNLGNPGPDPTVEVQLLRRLESGALTETITLISRADEPVRARLAVMLAGDGCELAALKEGLPAPPLLPARSDGAQLVWSDAWHESVVGSSPAPARIVPGDDARPSRLEFDVLLPGGAPVTIVLRLRIRRTCASGFDADPGAGLVDWSDRHVEAADLRLPTLVRTSLTDLRHLLLTDPAAPGDVFAGAGTPWYLTLFGRDSMWTARFVLPVDTTLALGTLRTLARRQGRRHDAETGEEPGKILHEVRRAEAGGAVANALPPVYYGTVDATALWVILLHEAWLWGLPDETARELLPAARAAMGWIQEAAGNDLGVLRYVDRSGRGLANQGWKDSGDSMRFHDGTIATGPIALLEAQAYAVEAARGAARLCDAFGESGGEALRAWAEAMTATIRERFWVERDGRRYLALALDGQGRPVDGLGSNMGHALGTGALTAAEARSVVSTLMSPALLGDFGIRTLSRDNAAYNPIGYHTGSVWTHDTAIALLGMVKEGLAQEAAAIATGMVAAAVPFGYRPPELFAGEAIGERPAPYPASCRPQGWAAASAVALVSAVLGLRADVPRGRLTLRPMRPSPFGPVRVSGLRWAGVPFTVALDGDGRPTVAGLPDDVVLDIA